MWSCVCHCGPKQIYIYIYDLHKDIYIYIHGCACVMLIFPVLTHRITIVHDVELFKWSRTPYTQDWLPTQACHLLQHSVYSFATQVVQVEQNSLHRRWTAHSGLPSLAAFFVLFCHNRSSSETEHPTQKIDRPFRLVMSCCVLCTALQRKQIE